MENGNCANRIQSLSRVSVDQLSNRPRAKYMQRQGDITSNMRTILVDWLIEVADEYHLHRETLFLAVNFVDRFLSQMAVQRSKLQLVGTAAMFIAASVLFLCCFCLGFRVSVS